MPFSEFQKMIIQNIIQQSAYHQISADDIQIINQEQYSSNLRVLNNGLSSAGTSCNGCYMARRFPHKVGQYFSPPDQGTWFQSWSILGKEYTPRLFNVIPSLLLKIHFCICYLFVMSLYTNSSKIGTFKSVICCLLCHLLVTY